MYRNKKHNYPLYEVRPLSSLRELVDGAAADFGDRPYVKYKKNGEVVEVSYKRFKQLVDSYGTQLCRLGISSGHIAIIGDNCYEWLLSYVTALNCDGVPYGEVKSVYQNGLFRFTADTTQFPGGVMAYHLTR